MNIMNYILLTAFFYLCFYSVPTLLKKTIGIEQTIMRGSKSHEGQEIMVSVGLMVPENHFLRAIEATINFTFIKKQLTTYYCKDSGRLSIHPIVLFKVISIEYC